MFAIAISATFADLPLARNFSYVSLHALLYRIHTSAAALVCIRYNRACKDTYEKLRAKGKSAKVALIAIANKLIRQAFAVVTNNQPYIDGFVSSLA